MEDKIRLLMEETGCDRGEAELALTEAGYDVERAVRTISTLLRHIVVLKAKLRTGEAPLYGLFLIVADTKRGRTIRVRSVASYNPSLYETVLAQDWYDFERQLYGFRLMEGAHPSLTKEMELLLDGLWDDKAGLLFPLLQEGKLDPLRDELLTCLSRKFQWGGLTLEISREELNLAQYRQLKRDGAGAGDPEPPRRIGFEPGPGHPLTVGVRLETDAGGIQASELSLGDTVFSVISDERDIARYLARLLGSRAGQSNQSLPTPVESLVPQGDEIRVFVRLTTGVVGAAVVPASQTVRIDRQVNGSWWKRWLPWAQ